MSLDTRVSDTAVSPVEQAKLLRSGEVISLLNVEWSIVSDRETVARISDSLGLAVRPSPQGQRRWTREEVGEIARWLALRQSDILARGTVDTLLPRRCEPAVRRLLDAVFEVAAGQPRFTETSAA